jgi:ferrochelatase
MVAEYRRRYSLIGGSPQNRILESLRTKLERRLREARPNARVFLGTKHWKPNVATVLPGAVAEGYRRFVAIPLSPYASGWILRPYEGALEQGKKAAGTPVEVELRAGWHLNSHLIQYWARAIQHAVQGIRGQSPVVLLSAHTLPQRLWDRGDPYPDLLGATSRAIVAAGHLERWSFAYQSAGNTTEPWLGPDITEVMTEWKRRGATDQVVASFGFVFDHLEVLYDLDVVVKSFAEQRGIRYHRVPMPNDAHELVEALAEVAGQTHPSSVLAEAGTPGHSVS